MSINLYPHNENAYRAALDMMEHGGRAAVIHPTGTGKSFIGFKLAEEHRDERIIWLTPSEHIVKTQLENLRAEGADELVNITFITYARLMMMTDTELGALMPDYIILDEFHRCGAEMWGRGVSRLTDIFPKARLLGLSATNIRYLDNRRDMAEELFGGRIASEMTLGEAVVRGILMPPTYVTTVYSYQKDLLKYQSRIQNTRNKAVRDKAQKQFELLCRALENADGLDVIFRKYITDRDGKYLVFCADKEHMDEMSSHAGEWFSLIDSAPRIYKAYSGDRAAGEEFSAFKADAQSGLKLLFCIDMLNEGVHVDDISGVILFRPTVSPIVFKQQIGRAMSAGNRKNAVILDIVDNISGLYSISTVREEMQNAIDFYRYYGEGGNVVNEEFTVIDEVYDCRRLFDELEETLSASWDIMYLEAEKYYRENGDLLTGSHFVTELGYPLGQWLTAQRAAFRSGKLMELHIERLSAIGMDWDTRSERLWRESFCEAEKFYRKHGHLRVPQSNKRLSAWIIRQREKYRANELGEEKYLALSDIGMIWEPESAWEIHFPEAKRFFEQNGHLDIPANYVTEGGVKLGAWYRSIRNAFREGTLPPERLAELEKIGMQQSSVNLRAWQGYYALAEEYFRERGDLEVPGGYIAGNGKKLGVWISTQRQSKKQGKLSAEQVEMLDKIGMSWQQYTSKWQAGYDHAAQYHAQFGNLGAAAAYVSPDGFRLGAWIAVQRSKYKSGRLEKGRIKLLEELGISWSCFESGWQKGLCEAEQYFAQHGDLLAPAAYVSESGFKLGTWLANQRVQYKKGKLSDEQVSSLEKCGMCWDIREKEWQRGFSEAKRYFEKHGNVNIPKGYSSEDGFDLAGWIAANRRAYLKGSLKQERINRLEELNIVWKTRQGSRRAV